MDLDGNINKKIAIIDADSLVFSAGHGNKIIEEYDSFEQPVYKKENGKLVYVEKTDDELKASTDELMCNIMNRGQFTHYIIYIKGKDTIKHKLNINPNYKQDRNKEQPKWWNFIKEYLVNKYEAVIANNYEVDDYVVSHFKQLPNSHIVAIDSDILSVEGTHYNWRKDEWVTSTKDNETFAFWSQMITGNHNNIKGIPGKGIKYAEKLFEKLNYKTDLEYAELVFSDYLVNFKLEGIEEYYKNYKSIKIFDSVNIDDNPIKEWNLF